MLSWERFVYPDLLDAWHEQSEYDDTYSWYMHHRLTIPNLLGIWGDQRASQALHHALQKCWEMELLGQMPRSFSEEWHRFEDELAYALGQLEAWHALDGVEALGLHPAYYKLARLYLVIGSLQLNIRMLDKWNIRMLIDIGAIDPDRVVAILQQRFGLDKYVAGATLKVFPEWYSNRTI